MNIKKFDFTLPKSYIAQSPVTPRDSSKLLVLDRKTKKIVHRKFNEIEKSIKKNDVLVFNNTKVFPARLIGKKRTGGKAEVLLLKDLGDSKWESITKPGFVVGDNIFFEGFTATVTKKENYETEIKFSLEPAKLKSSIFKIGNTPIPPYIKTALSEKELREKYQTVYAQRTGSAAAPTAGFHFTKRLLKKLKDKGIQTEYVTLHVGLGTFAPVKEDNIEDHNIHSEYFEVDKQTIKRLRMAKKEGKRIVSVGTTSTRVLETLAERNGRLETTKLRSETDLFIYPPYKFRFVDAMITNFHLPKSTLLALVSAFVSYPNTDNKFKDFRSSILGKAYRQALENNYRFYSFGDACLII